MEKPYIVYESEKVGAKSLLFKRAAEKNNEFLRTKTVEENREAKRKLASLYFPPPKVTVRPVVLDCVDCEWISSPGCSSERVILYIHGGSWMLGNLQTARPVGVMMAEHSLCPVLAVDYRLAPEHPYPAGLTDCLKVYHALLREGYAPGNIALFGDSAGGNLSLALLYLLREEHTPLPSCVACASPVTNLTADGELMRLKPDLLFTYYLGEEWNAVSLYLTDSDPALPTVSPVKGDMTGFPPIMIHVGEDEELCGDNTAFADAAHACGVKVICKVWKEMYHDFTIVGNALKEGRQSMEELAAFIRMYITPA